jgi:hypothetical protein
LRDIVYDDPSNGHTVHAAAYLHVFSVRWYNQSFLCVARSPSLQNKAIVADTSGNLISVNVPYRRLAVLPNPIVSIRVTANQDDNLAITWTDSTGVSQMLLVPSGTTGQRAARGVELALDSTFDKVVSGESLQLRARVAGSINSAVRWSVALGPGAPGGAPTGSVSATGRYEAPAGVNAPYPVIVVAQSVADASKLAMGVVSLQPQTRMTMAAPSDDGARTPTLKPVAAFTVSEARTGAVQ